MSDNNEIKTLYIKNINRRMAIKEIKRRLTLLTTRFFPIKKIKITGKKGLEGQAFILIPDDYSLEKAIKQLNKRFFMGTVLNVEKAKKNMVIGGNIKIKNNSCMLILKNIPEEIKKDDIDIIFDKFNGFKKIRYIKSKKLAFIDFESVDDATEVLKYNYSEIMKYKNNVELTLEPSA